MAEFVMHHPRSRSAESGGQRLLLVLIGVLSTAVVLEIVFHLLIAPQFALSRVVVESDLPLSDEQVLEIARLDGSEDYFSLSTALVVENLRTYPLIKNAQVEKIFPDTITIRLESRKPVAITFAVENGRSIPLLVDEEGVVFQKGAEGIADWSLPVLSGIQFERVTVGTQLPKMLLPFLQDMRTLQLGSPVHFDLISEYRIVRKSDYDFEVVIYPISHPVPVRIGDEISEELCNFLMVALDVLGAEGKLQDVREIDFRTGEIVYKLREG